jgi:hypothetical protein
MAQRPTIRPPWKMNVGRKRRGIEEAVAIAKANGVQIPNDVEFFEDEDDELIGSLKEFLAGGQMDTARGPDAYSINEDYVYWDGHYNERTGKIPFRVHPDILASDEAIVGTFEHEMYELAKLRAVFVGCKRWRMGIADYASYVQPGIPGNLHCQAWDAADRAVQRMREAKA